mgnify:CR=1 FL=1
MPRTKNSVIAARAGGSSVASNARSDALRNGQWPPPVDPNYKVDTDHLEAGFSTGAGQNKNQNKRRPVVEGGQVNVRKSRRILETQEEEDDCYDEEEISHLQQPSVAGGEHDDDDDDDDDRLDEVVEQKLDEKVASKCVKGLRDPITKVVRTRISDLRRDVMPQFNVIKGQIQTINNTLEETKAQVEAQASNQTELHEDMTNLRTTVVDGLTWLSNRMGQVDARMIRVEKMLNRADV